MLSSMPVDVLKMDIAHSLKVPVVAEGVETKSQLQLLKEMGCALVQGYYFSRPLSPDVFIETGPLL